GGREIRRNEAQRARDHEKDGREAEASHAATLPGTRLRLLYARRPAGTFSARTRVDSLRASRLRDVGTPASDGSGRQTRTRVPRPPGKLAGTATREAPSRARPEAPSRK